MRSILLIFLTLIFQFSFAQKNTLVITEILADPSPSIGLPEREFVEVFNNSNEKQSTKGFKLLYGNFTANFPDSILQPKTYYILCRRGFEAEFSPFGKVIPLPNFSLPNDGTLLILKNSKEEVLHYVDYKADWYNQATEGGQSLEMVNLENACLGSQNWQSSRSSKGGTPGLENSVNSTTVDSNPPKFVNYTLDKQDLIVEFDKNLAVDFLFDAENFELTEGTFGISKVGFNTFKKFQITITLNRSVELGENAVLLIKKPEDCLGNVGQDVWIDFSNLEPARVGDIVLTEVLFNPKVGGEDFVEIYNQTDKSFSLKNWKIANLDDGGNIKDIENLVTFDLKIKPKEYLAFTTNGTFLRSNYPASRNIIEISQLPSFNNDKGGVVLLNSDSVEIDRFEYSEKMHHPLIINPDGVSLERVNFGEKLGNWMSAAADVGFATPGSKNSQEVNNELQEVFFAEPVVFNPFQKSNQESTFLKYKLANNGMSASIMILDRYGRKVRTLANNTLLGTNGEIEWDGRGNSGELLPVGYYIFVINTYSGSTNKTFTAKCVLGSN